MKLHLVTRWEDLDQVEADYEAAKTIEEYERADAAFFAFDPVRRAAWLEMKDPDLYCMVTD